MPAHKRTYVDRSDDRARRRSDDCFHDESASGVAPMTDSVKSAGGGVSYADCSVNIVGTTMTKNDKNAQTIESDGGANETEISNGGGDANENGSGSGNGT